MFYNSHNIVIKYVFILYNTLLIEMIYDVDIYVYVDILYTFFYYYTIFTVNILYENCAIIIHFPIFVYIHYNYITYIYYFES